MDSRCWECEKRWQISPLANLTRPMCQLVIPTRDRRQPRSSSPAVGETQQAPTTTCACSTRCWQPHTFRHGGGEGWIYGGEKLHYGNICFSHNHGVCNHVHLKSLRSVRKTTHTITQPDPGCGKTTSLQDPAKHGKQSTQASTLFFLYNQFQRVFSNISVSWVFFRLCFHPIRTDKPSRDCNSSKGC